MERNVLSWNQALDNGYEPVHYPYNVTDIPEGTYTARLDFKMWARKTMAVSCYFTLTEINRKCWISVFRDRMLPYKIPESSIDFTNCPCKQLYEIEMVYNGNNKMLLKGAHIL